MGAINDWPGRSAAERLRQWPRVLELAEAAGIAPFLGVVLLGSFARGEADDLSDVDFIVFAPDGRFEEAWELRHRLHPDDAVCRDYPRPPGDRDVAGHRWLTSDFVLFDGLIATPSGSRVADPLHVLVGGEKLSRQLVKRGPVTPAERQSRKDEVALHEIEQLYGRLKLAVRAERLGFAKRARVGPTEGARGGNLVPPRSERQRASKREEGVLGETCGFPALASRGSARRLPSAL